MHNMLILFPSSSVFLAFVEPAAVRTLAITDVTTSSVSLDWTEPEGNATSYTVWWTAGEDSFNGTTTETSFTIEDLIPGVQYNIRVAAVAVNPSNNGEMTSITTFTSRSTLTKSFFQIIWESTCLSQESL